MDSSAFSLRTPPFPLACQSEVHEQADASTRFNAESRLFPPGKPSCPAGPEQTSIISTPKHSEISHRVITNPTPFLDRYRLSTPPKAYCFSESPVIHHGRDFFLSSSPPPPTTSGSHLERITPQDSLLARLQTVNADDQVTPPRLSRYTQAPLYTSSPDRGISNSVIHSSLSSSAPPRTRWNYKDAPLSPLTPIPREYLLDSMEQSPEIPLAQITRKRRSQSPTSDDDFATPSKRPRMETTNLEVQDASAVSSSSTTFTRRTFPLSIELSDKYRLLYRRFPRSTLTQDS